MPIAILAEALARLRRSGEPLVTTDGVRMARKRMYFRSTKAERELGYRARPAEAALADALEWYRGRGDLR
jgi:dihydroflavonol-4-reductase